MKIYQTILNFFFKCKKENKNLGLSETINNTINRAIRDQAILDKIGSFQIDIVERQRRRLKHLSYILRKRGFKEDIELAKYIEKTGKI